MFIPSGGCGCPEEAACTPPAIADISNVTVCEGVAIVIAAAVTGTGPLVYQWYLGASGDFTTPIVNGGSVSGATTATLTIDPSTEADEGNYWLYVQGECGNASSNTVAVTVNQAPTIPDIANQSVCAGDSVTFDGTASGTAVITYQWYRGASGNTGTPIGGATSATYTIGVVVDGDAGNYWVRATNACGHDDSNTIVLTVNDPPTVTLDPPPPGPEFGPTTITAIVTGTGPFTYVWQSSIVGAGGPFTPTGDTADHIDVNPLVPTWYRVIVSNACGDDTSDALEVDPIPTLPEGAVFIMDVPAQADISAGAYNSIQDSSGNAFDLAYVSGGKAVVDAVILLDGHSSMRPVNDGVATGSLYRSGVGVTLAASFFAAAGIGTVIDVFFPRVFNNFFGSKDNIWCNATEDWVQSIVAGPKFQGESNAIAINYATNLTLNTSWYVSTSRFNGTNIRNQIDNGTVATQAGDARTASTDRLQAFYAAGSAGTCGSNMMFTVFWPRALTDPEVVQAKAYLKYRFPSLNV